MGQGSRVIVYGPNDSGQYDVLTPERPLLSLEPREVVAVLGASAQRGEVGVDYFAVDRKTPHTDLPETLVAAFLEAMKAEK